MASTSCNSNNNDGKTFLHWHLYDLNHISFQIQGRALFLLSVFFSILLLLSLLFFYMSRVCRRAPRTREAVYDLPTTHRAVAMIASVGHGLDAVIIDSLPVVLHSSLAVPIKEELEAGGGKDDGGCELVSECSICLSLFEDEEMVKVLPICHHTYHSACVDRWLSTQSSCPLCRASLRVVHDPVGSSAVEVEVSC